MPQPSWACRVTLHTLVSRHKKEFLYDRGLILAKAAKCAVRALADTLRMEVLRLSGPISNYTIHCAFPANFISPAFLEEQKVKPLLTKRMEGTTGSIADMEKRLPSSRQIARGIIAGVEKGDFAICSDSVGAACLFANMTGPSPKRGLGIVDSILAPIVGLIVWPMLRRWWDEMCRRDRRHMSLTMDERSTYSK